MHTLSCYRIMSYSFIKNLNKCPIPQSCAQWAENMDTRNKNLRHLIGIIIILTLGSFIKTDKDLKTIIKDGQFSKIPKTAKNVKTEIINEGILRYGYLYFEGESTDIKNWVQKSKLQKTHTLEIFEKNIMVDPRKTPKWIKEIEQSYSREVYYSQRQADSFTTLVYHNTQNNSIYIEYQRRK